MDFSRRLYRWASEGVDMYGRGKRGRWRRWRRGGGAKKDVMTEEKNGEEEKESEEGYSEKEDGRRRDEKDLFLTPGIPSFLSSEILFRVTFEEL